MRLQEYYKELIGKDYVEPSIGDGEELFFQTCLEFCMISMIENGLKIEDYRYIENEYEDDFETIMKFRNKITGKEIRLKVTHNESYSAELHEI